MLIDLIYYPQNAQNYWQSYHLRNNRNMRKHLFSHVMLCGVALRKREPVEIIRQSWLGMAVIPVHCREFIREKL